MNNKIHFKERSNDGLIRYTVNGKTFYVKADEYNNWIACGLTPECEVKLEERQCVYIQQVARLLKLVP